MTYTASVLVAAGLAIVLDVAVLRTRMVTRRAFWTAYAIVGKLLSWALNTRYPRPIAREAATGSL